MILFSFNPGTAHMYGVRISTYLTDANVVAPLAFNNRCIVIDIQDVDGEGVVCVSGRRAVVNGTHLKQQMYALVCTRI